MKKKMDFLESSVVSSVTDFADPEVSTGALNDLLRQQLNSTLHNQIASTEENKSEHPPTKQKDDLSTCLVKTVTEILHAGDSNIPLIEVHLNELFERLNLLYQHADIDPVLRKRQFIARHGLVMSPDHCTTTQKDTRRVTAFIRGTHQAIAELKKKNSACLHLVYPACGPFAPLLLPLIAYYRETEIYSENDLRITLIDMQAGAVESLQVLVHEMRVSGYVQEISCQDACEYQPEIPVHMVILEAMQHGFSREGHLPIAQHFAALMEPDGIFLPKGISIRAVLTMGHQEFVEQWQEESKHVSAVDMTPAIMEARIDLGEILHLTSASALQLPEKILDEHTRLVECGEVVLPELPTSMTKPLLIICTHINVFGHESIGEYDSGITHPLPDMHVCVNFVPHDAKPGDLLVKSGDKLKFYYRLNGLPGFMATLSV